MTAEEALEVMFGKDHVDCNSSPNDIYASYKDISINSGYNEK